MDGNPTSPDMYAPSLINDCQAVIKAIEIRLEKPVSVFPAALNS